MTESIHSLRRYDSTNDRIILSPTSLKYAEHSNGRVCIDKIRRADLKKCSILINTLQAELLCSPATNMAYEHYAHYEHEAACENDTASAPSATNPVISPTPFYQNYCILDQGEIYINDGGYKNLKEFISSASPDELAYALTQVAMQAALTQMEITRLTRERVSSE